MALFSMSFVYSLAAFQICVVLMMGSFDSTESLGIEGPEIVSWVRLLRRPISVQGVVYCKSCKFHGIDTLSGASPLPGAIVRLLCYNRRNVTVTEGKTDKNGYFFIQPYKVTTFGAHKCKIFLASSPLETCKKPTNINGGVTGARLLFEKKLMGSTHVALYSSGPFAFGPTSNSSCPHSP